MSNNLSPLEQTECLSKVCAGFYPDVLSYAALEHPILFNELISSKKKNIGKNDQRTLNVILTNMKFDEHLHRISQQYQRMKKKSPNSLATTAFETLLRECIQAKINLYQSDDVDKIDTFKGAYTKAIGTATLTLKNNPEWSKVLPSTFVSQHLSTVGIFSRKSKSEKLMEELKKGINDVKLSP